MVSIVPELQVTNDPSYLQYSRERQGNKALGVLFEGLGEAATGAAVTVDNAVQNRVKADVYAGVDAIRNSQGVQPAVDAVNAGNAPPPAVSSGVSEIKRLAAAQAAGKLSDSYYYARLESYVRELRTKYPGYREIIDQQVASVTGVTPANALRAAVLREYEQNQTNAQAEDKELRTYFRGKAEFINPQDMAAFNAGDRSPALIAKIKGQISNQEWYTQGMKTRRLELDTSEAEQKATGRTYSQKWDAHANDTVTAAVAGAMESLGPKLKSVQEQAASGQVVNPQDLQILQQTMAQQELQLEAKLRADFTKRGLAGPDQSYQSRMVSQEEGQKSIDNAMKPFRALRAMLADPSALGIAAANAKLIAGRKDG